MHKFNSCYMFSSLNPPFHWNMSHMWVKWVEISVSRWLDVKSENTMYKHSLSQHQCLCLASHLAVRDPALPHLTACYLTSSCTREPLITVPPAFRSAPAKRLLDRSKITHQSKRLFNTACPDKVAPLSHEIKSEWEKVEEPFHSLRVHRHHYHHWDCMNVTAQHRCPPPNIVLKWSEQSCLEN